MHSLAPHRLTPCAYPISCEISARVSDMDGYGHLNALRIGQYYEEARAAFYRQALDGLKRSRVLVAEIKLRYLNEGFWPGTLQVSTGISKVGGSSFHMAQGLFQHGRCLGLCETVLVNTGEGRPSRLPDDLRSALESLQVRAELAAT